MVLMTIITRRDCEKRQVTSQDFIHWRICSHCIQFFRLPNARIGAPGFHHYLIIDMNTDTWRQPEIANLIIQAGAGVLIPVAWVFWHLILGNKIWSFGSFFSEKYFKIHFNKQLVQFSFLSSQYSMTSSTLTTLMPCITLACFMLPIFLHCPGVGSHSRISARGSPSPYPPEDAE